MPRECIYFTTKMALKYFPNSSSMYQRNSKLNFWLLAIILAAVFWGCGGDVDERIVQFRSLRKVIPESNIPANSRIVFIFSGSVDAGAIEIDVTGVSGEVRQYTPMTLIWQPTQLLPLGEANIEIVVTKKTEATINTFLVREQKFTIIPPDEEPPKLLGSSPSDGATDVTFHQSSGQFEITFTFSEPVDWKGATVQIVPNLGLDRRTKEVVPLEARHLSLDYQTIFVSASKETLKGITYTVSCSGITDLSGNLEPHFTISFTTAAE